jgi:hypothetical protein
MERRAKVTRLVFEHVSALTMPSRISVRMVSAWRVCSRARRFRQLRLRSLREELQKAIALIERTKW